MINVCSNEDRTRRISWISLYNYCGLQKSCESKVDSVNDQLIVTTIVNQDNTEASTTTINTRTELKEDELQTIVVLSIINSSVSLNLACQSRRNQDMKNCRRCCRIQVVIRNVTNQETWNVGMSDKGRQEQSSFRLARSSNVKTPNSTMYSNWSKDNAAFHVSHWSGAEYFCVFTSLFSASHTAADLRSSYFSLIHCTLPLPCNFVVSQVLSVAKSSGGNVMFWWKS